MSIHLWRSLPPTKQKHLIQRFTGSEPARLVHCGLSEMAWFLQLIFEIDHIQTAAVHLRADHLDLDLRNDSMREYLRFYPQSPISAAFTLTTDLQSRNYRRLYLYTFGAFGMGDCQAQNNNPFFLRLKERDELIQIVGAAQNKIRNGDFKAPSPIPGSTYWTRIVNRLKRTLIY